MQRWDDIVKSDLKHLNLLFFLENNGNQQTKMAQ